MTLSRVWDWLLQWLACGCVCVRICNRFAIVSGVVGLVVNVVTDMAAAGPCCYYKDRLRRFHSRRRAPAHRLWEGPLWNSVLLSWIGDQTCPLSTDGPVPGWSCTETSLFQINIEEDFDMAEVLAC